MKDKTSTEQDAEGIILDRLEPLFERAAREGLWFFCAYQALWFSPAELRAAHAEGRFRWGAVNWSLRDPRERMKELDAEAKAVEARQGEWKRRMAAAGCR